MSMVMPSKLPIDAPPKPRDLAAARARARTAAWLLAALAVGFYVAIVVWNVLRGLAAAGAS
jgi:hypothetical protein